MTKKIWMIYMGSKSLKVLNKEGDSEKLDYEMVESALMVKGLTIDIYNKQFICFVGFGPYSWGHK